MSVSDDIGNLFQRFGGNPDRYQEVARDDDAKHAASRWPLLSALDIARPEQVPGAGRPAPAMSAMLAKQTPDLGSTAAATAANGLAAPTAEHDNAMGDLATSALQRSPLFARSHRHAMMPPPVDAARQAASRFSPPPHAALTAGDAEAAPTAPAASAVDARVASDAMREVARQHHAGFFANRKKAFARAPIMGAPVNERAPIPFEQPKADAPTQPRPHAQPHAQPQSPAQRSILSSLFTAPPAHEAQPSAQPAARALTAVFARLAAASHRNDTGVDKKPGGERS